MNLRKLAATGVIAAILVVVAVFALRGGESQKASPSTTRLRAEVSRPVPVKSAAAPPADRPAHAPKASPGGVTAAEWKKRFWAADRTNDYLRFVKEAMPAAQQGDGRAAWYIWRALSSCPLVIRNYRGSADPEAQLQQELTGGTPGVPQAANLPQWVIDEQEHNTRRCLGLAKEDPFAGLPPPPGGFVCAPIWVRSPPCNYSSSAYWLAQASADGDPLAQAEIAGSALADIAVDPQMPDETKTAKLKMIQDNLRAVVASGDPDALYLAGNLLMNPLFTNDTLRGLAVALASCELGRDCSADNPDNLWSKCIVTGSCAPNTDYADILQQSLGQEGYAQLYARAQQVVELARAGDHQGLLAYLRIDKHP